MTQKALCKERVRRGEMLRKQGSISSRRARCCSRAPLRLLPKNPPASRVPYAGSMMVNTVCSGVDAHSMVPPCAVTISFAIASPKPAPPRFVARAASSR